MRIHKGDPIDLGQKVLEHNMNIVNKKRESDRIQKLRVHNKVRRIGEKMNSLADISMKENNTENLVAMWMLFDSIRDDLNEAEIEVKRMYL